MKPLLSFAARLALVLTLAISAAQSQTTATVNSDKVNVRGRPTLFSEVITQLRAGEKVSVLEQVEIQNPKLGEPVSWAKIAMPENTPLWVNASFVDSASKTVRARKLNVRAGPSETFSIVGVLAKDAVIKEIRTVEGWMEIEPPEGAYAFVAMEYLDKPTADANAEPPLQSMTEPDTKGASSASKPAETVTPPPAVPVQEKGEQKAEETPEVVPGAVKAEAEVKPEEAAKAEPAAAAVERPAPSTPPTAPPSVPTPTSPPAASAVTPPPSAALPLVTRRIVRREGVLKTMPGVLAQTYFELVSADSRKVMNYVLASSPDMDLKSFKGRQVLVIGEEVIDKRWPKVPVILVETVELAP